MAKAYHNKKNELKSKLCEILPKIKGNGADEQELREVIKNYDASSFSKAKTLHWLKTLEDEVIYVDSLIKLAKNKGIPMATVESQFQGKRLQAEQGLFYLEAKFLSCLKITGEEENGVVSLRAGSFLDDDDFRANFGRQFNNFMTAIGEGGLRNKDADVDILFYLEFLAEDNQCDIKFYEMGYDALSEIDTNGEVGSVKYEPDNNAVTGEIAPKYGRPRPVAAEGGFIKLQLRYREDKAEVDPSDEESKWDNRRDFDHPAEKMSFQLDLGELHGLQDGSHYSAQIRYQIR